MYFLAEKPFPRVITLLLNLGLAQWMPESWKGNSMIFHYWNPIVLTLLLFGTCLTNVNWVKWKNMAYKRLREIPEKSYANSS